MYILGISVPMVWHHPFTLCLFLFFAIINVRLHSTSETFCICYLLLAVFFGDFSAFLPSCLLNLDHVLFVCRTFGTTHGIPKLKITWIRKNHGILLMQQTKFWEDWHQQFLCIFVERICPLILLVSIWEPL